MELKLPHGTVALTTVLLGAIGLWLLGKYDAMVNGEINATSAETEFILKLGKAYQARLATSEKAEAANKKNALRWQDSALTLTRNLPPVVTSSDTLWQRALFVTRASATSCFAALVACDSAKKAAIDRSGVLELQLQRQLAVGKCKILFITCPTRATAFVAGGVFGTVITVVLVGVLN